MTTLEEVKEFWNRSSCGEIYAEGDNLKAQYESEKAKRYQFEPYILEFGAFKEAENQVVLEIGVGMGADHEQLAISNPKALYGIDLTERAIHHTKLRLDLLNLNSRLEVGNSEELHFQNDFFDWVYSWGVLHHSPDTQQAISEVYRVLKPGGKAKVMIYHKYSWVGLLLWLRYALLAMKPWRSMNFIYAHYLESPGTKAYTVSEATKLFSIFSKVTIVPQLSFGDLLEGEVGQRHRHWSLSLLKKIWPRWVIKKTSRFFNFGLYLLIEAKK
jgi:ubiquinone/menaquinone biosynthesis C-methylase UbiE